MPVSLLVRQLSNFMYLIPFYNNRLFAHIWFQVFLSNTHNLQAIIWFQYIFTNSLVLVSAFTLVGLNRLPPEQVICCSLKKILWDLIEGRVQSPTQKKRPVCRRSSTDALTKRPEATGCQSRHFLDFHQSPFSRFAALIPLGARPIRLGWPNQEPKFPTV